MRSRPRWLLLGMLASALTVAATVIADCPSTEAWGPTNGGSTCWCNSSYTGCSTSHNEVDCVDGQQSFSGVFCCHDAPNGAQTECLAGSGSSPANCYKDVTCSFNNMNCTSTDGQTHTQYPNTTATCGT